jgi:hypothetical protein
MYQLRYMLNFSLFAEMTSEGECFNLMEVSNIVLSIQIDKLRLGA